MNTPKAIDGTRKSTVISFRLTAKEAEELKSLAANLDLSLPDFILAQTIYSNQKFIHLDKTTLSNLAKQVSIIFNNFNQAVRALNIVATSSVARSLKEKRLNEAIQIICEEHSQREEALNNINAVMQKLLIR